MTGLVSATARWAATVKLAHTVFALPFAFAGAALAAAGHGITFGQVLWIAVAMFAARNAAMGFNRLVDHRIDAQNPRTKQRELPRGAISRRTVTLTTVVLAALFVLAAFMLNPLCGRLSPLALLIVLGYSFSKRFTWLSHVWLGLALAVAPVGGFVAVRGEFALAPWLLGLAVLAWVAGFDVIYACQDADFDRQAGLHSIPARFGTATALQLARLFHGLALLALAAVGVTAELHRVYWFGLAGIALLLIWEHRLVKPGDLAKVGIAFFNLNAIIAIAYLATVLAAVWIGSF